MAAVSKTLLARYDPAGERQAMISRNYGALKVGQAISVYAYNNYPAQTPVSVFSGHLMAIRRAGVESSVRLRTQVMRTGTEMRFPLFSPTIKEIRIIRETPPRKIRRAKLFYMRDPRHDRGNVDTAARADRERLEAQEKLEQKKARAKAKAESA